MRRRRVNHLPDELVVTPATSERLRAAHSVLLLAGEHMDRAQGMSHWWPWLPFDEFAGRVRGRDTVLATVGDQLVATWNTSTLPEPYHDLSVWPEPDAPALFLSAFGVLPGWWGLGVGAAALTHVEATAVAAGLDRVRFDAVTSNHRVVRWYARHGFTEVGRLQATETVEVTCFEKHVG